MATRQRPRLPSAVKVRPGGEALQVFLWLGQGLPLGSAFQDVGNFMPLMSA